MAPFPSVVREQAHTIGYDASSTVGQRTGIGTCAAHLLDALAEELPQKWVIRALVNSARLPLPPNDAWLRAPNIKLTHTKIPGRVLMRSWQYLRTPPIEMFIGSIGLHHSPASYVTPTIRAAKIITVHDLFFLRQPDPIDRFGGESFARTFPRGLRQADRILTVSSYTRDEVLATYNVDPGKVIVVPNGYDERSYNQSPKPDDQEIAERWSRGEPYLLCVASSGPSPRKNLIGLLEAYAKARQFSPLLAPLVVAGHIGIERDQTEFELALNRLKLAGSVRRTGYLRPDQLAAMYRRAAALIMPSLCEGFGLPVLEAMASGCPVLAANTGSLPEVAGGAAELIDVESTEQMAASIVKVVSDSVLRERMKIEGLAQARRFSWKSAAKMTIEVYADVFAERSARRR